MSLRQNLVNVYNELRSNEELLRLLYYEPKNANDNPLDNSKENILDKSNADRHKIISSVLIPSDKTYDLTLNTRISRVCVYTGERIKQRNNRGYAKSNIYVSDQQFVFDVYTHLEIDIVDFRMMWICDVLNEILFKNHITDIGHFKFEIGFPIMNTPNGFAGYRMIYTMSSSQSPSDC